MTPEQPEDFLAEIVPGTNNAWTIAKKLGLGWNLGNQLEAQNNGVASETAWGNAKATQATFDGLKAKGITAVRIPVTWLGHIGAAPEYKIDEAWMNRVAEVVGYAEKAGLMAIVNIHHAVSRREPVGPGVCQCSARDRRKQCFKVSRHTRLLYESGPDHRESGPASGLRRRQTAGCSALL